MNKKTIVSSLIYKFAERLAVKGMGLLIGIVLARLLVPEQFGQVAIITVFINLAQTIVQSGLGTALVQKKEVDEKDYSTAFYLSVGMAILLVVILYACAPFIARYYELPSLTWPIRVYAFSLLFGAFNSVQVAKMQREMRFRAMMWASLAATVLSGVLGVAMAYMGFGIWALVVYGCSNVVFSCFTMLITARWFPKLLFSWDRAKALFGFGWKMLVSGVLCSLYADIRALIIGKKYSADDLGYYNRGQQYPYIISNTLDSAIQSVMFPAVAREQDDKAKMRLMLRRSMSMNTWVLFPVLAGFAMTARPLVLLMLTEKWLPCVIYMQIICFAELAMPFSTNSLMAIKAMGRSDIYMWLEIVRRIIMLAILVGAIVLFDSVVAIAISYVISMWLDIIIVAIPLKKLLNYGFFAQMKDNWKSILATALMCVSVYFVGLWQANTVLVLCTQIAVGVIAYVASCFVLRNENFLGVISALRNFKK